MHEKCCNLSLWKKECIFILLQVLNCFCVNVVMVINEVAGNHLMTAVPHKRNLPTPDADENLVHLCITVVNSNSVELECIVSGVCLLQT